ncbi:ParB N-terminal domain-containing protein [Clostridium sp. WILCCON 0269]|uniref:ParB N-terminal domain-containing protein n=1 Tax=Candidatus Clostridium eludens TaxID=3381663 RepID=A0ABW8SG49_9CLOT
MIDINLLKPHPRNREIYGEEDIKELANKINESKFIKSLVISQDNVIVSGHRRYAACLLLNIKEIPYERVNFQNPDEELERLLLENEAREKTTYQKGQEAILWEELEKKKADQRRISTQNNDKAQAVREKVPTQEEGRVRDIVAHKVGIGSGKTYEKAKSVIKEIDKLKREGEKNNAEFLTEVLNTSVTGAKNIMKSDSLNKISDDLKNKVVKKEITAKEAIKLAKKELKAVENGVSDASKVNKDSIIEEFQLSIKQFIQGINKYIELEDTFELMDEDDEDKVLDSIDELETTINKIKDIIL